MFLPLLLHVASAVKSSPSAVHQMERPRTQAAVARNFSQGTEVRVWSLQTRTVVPSSSSSFQPHLEEIFMGRCYSVQDDSVPLETALNCTRLWELFTKAFRYKDDVKVGMADFDEFFNAPEVKTSLEATGKWALFCKGIVVTLFAQVEHILRKQGVAFKTLLLRFKQLVICL
jgi:hypothetical protein